MFPLRREEVWATYEWVYPPTAGASESENMERQFIRANIDEVSGKSDEALQIYRDLYKKLDAKEDASPFVLKRVGDAVKRVRH